MLEAASMEVLSCRAGMVEWRDLEQQRTCSSGVELGGNGAVRLADCCLVCNAQVVYCVHRMCHMKDGAAMYDLAMCDVAKQRTAVICLR